MENVTHLAALASVAAYFFIVPAANAAQSEWLRSEGGDIRIVADSAGEDGTIPAILDIKLKPGWKTYWLEPGASGIAPQVTIDPQSGISLSGMRFPPPRTFDDGVVRYTGYDRSVAFPLALKRGKPGDLALKASVFLGLCKDICIPVQGELGLVLPGDGGGNPLDRARIDAAIAALPEKPADDFKVTTASFDPAAKRLRVALTVPAQAAGSMPELFFAGPPGYSFGKPEKMTHADGKVTAEVEVRIASKGGALKSGAVLLLARAGERSMETPLAFD